ncbi:hypothetical protein YC2023_077521 [Brassica napus]
MLSVSNSIDPRWPYLGKWSAAPLPGSASGAVKKDQLSVQTEVEDKASLPASETHQSLNSCASDDDSTSVLPGSTTEPCQILIEMTSEGVNMEAEVGDSKEELPAEILRGEEEMVQARLTAPSDQVVLLLENSAENLLTPKKSEPTARTLEITNKTVNENLQSLEDVDPEDLSTPVNNSTHSKAKSALADNSLASSHSLIHGSSSYNQIDQPLEQDDEDGSMGHHVDADGNSCKYSAGPCTPKCNLYCVGYGAKHGGHCEVLDV